ncbi:16S rRNA (adenine(1518)-N(6)/adenine(1519)-N(6))-dimethyltransferase RsmA [Afifella sp. IM 167]|uniref:16S rRNA (adenine(1518)-N(6)/adenine(1519)-N(6))- dimethyltransferase RsmA n=1 Tax=Afifella sp. IM 167 TaxID=2033586 RepID=UPI001CCAD83F|nr:16S rRNA (adenine(1518)-N(6)/adenine(1519)-N(6))-dimethyltransferase RsmA [Afifella sp. IM 167]MBZ8131727.1 16S rRNA (adenine(1518)-N(6)/adenine(1519)-N(6))-dimethyltransferase [Afifella sp. IM 167]
MNLTDGEVAERVARLPPLRQVIDAHGLRAQKSLGQNFLLDLNLTRRIARAGSAAGCLVIEVGPGPGGLTRALLMEGAREVIAIERDRRAIPALGELAAASGGRLRVLEDDALAADYAEMAKDAENVRIIANLPYNIATPLLTGWLTPEAWPPFWQSLTLMFQKEVAERIVAAPGDKAYGRLAVLAGWRSRAAIAFEVPPQAFTPPPKVTSALIRIEPRDDAASLPPRAVERVTAAAFGQRRKMLRQSLKAAFGRPEEVLEKVGIAPTARAEEVPVEGFLKLAGLYVEEVRSPASS